MLECGVCKVGIIGSTKKLFEHLKTKHGIHERYDKYVCSQGQCCRTFTNKYTFAKHLESCHISDIADADHGVADEMIAAPATGCFPIQEDGSAMILDTFPAADEPCEVDIKQLAAHFIYEAKSQIGTLSSVHNVIGACQHMFATVIDNIIGDVQNLKNDSVGHAIKQLVDKLETFRNPFAGLETEYSQNAYAEKQGILVKPETYTIGNKNSFVTDKLTGFQKSAKQAVTGQHVSIKKTIVALHANTDVVLTAAAVPNQIDCSTYCTFFDGKRWKRYAQDGRNIIVLRLYGDDFEPGNPLGSRKTLYKTGCIYFQFENMPAHMLSKTENMFLTLCYHSDDVKLIGWENVLRPLVNELVLLETDGFQLSVDGTLQTFHVLVSAITGDNLFLNSILGFVECFTASFPCRHCILHRNDFQGAYTEVPDKVRTVDSYDSAIDSLNVQETGIKQRCSFNRLITFHAAENFVQDIMHDLFEGVCAYDLPIICNNLIKQTDLTLDMLNHRIQNFNYGLHDKSNKPPVITSLSVDMFPFDASQMWCLTRVLSLAIGDLIMEDNPVWQFYIRLRNILDLLMAPSISESDLEYLQTIISEYLELHVLLFSASPLKNKHHHLTHYPRLIREVGPLNRFWCMRFESKHQRSKRLLHISGNFKNIPLTCANRHQHAVAFNLMTRSKIGDDQLMIGTGCEITLHELSDGMDINSVIGVGMMFELFNANWVEIRGIRYKPEMFVLSNIDSSSGLPMFVKIEHILIRDQGQHVWFCGQVLTSVYFSTHYHGWLVEESDVTKMQCVNAMELIYHLPLVLTRIKLPDGQYLLVFGLHYHL